MTTQVFATVFWILTALGMLLVFGGALIAILVLVSLSNFWVTTWNRLFKKPSKRTQ